MGVTTMAKISLFVAKLRQDFPNFSFKPDDDFYWSPSTQTICFAPLLSDPDRLTLLHEVAHATLGHTLFKRDIDLLKIEREAWDYVRDTLAPRYDMETTPDDIEDMLDTYRNWLHARSTCPHCSMTGIQIDNSEYRCLGCGKDWRVNDARRCGLRRYALTT
jgi:hypothetical protein